jgi:hypothetical protein
MYVFLLVVTLAMADHADFVARYLHVHYAHAGIDIQMQTAYLVTEKNERFPLAGTLLLCTLTLDGWRQVDQENISALQRAGYISDCTRRVVE